MTREIITKVKNWFHSRNILDNTTAQKQLNKLAEEVLELTTAIAEHRIYKGGMDEIADAIGDIQVVMIGLCMQYGLDFDDCLRGAYMEIQNRKGSMVNGLYVKEV